VNGLLDRALSAIHHSALTPRRTTASCGQKPYKHTTAAAALAIAADETLHCMGFVSKVLKN